MSQIQVPVNESSSQSELRFLWLPALFCLILIIAEIYLLVHDWGSTRASKTSKLGEPIAQFISGKKTVRQKTVGTLVWDTPSPNMELYRETAIATMDDSEAVLVFKDQSQIIVEPNSLLILEEAPHNLVSGGTGKTVIRLVKGSIKRKNVGTTPFFIKLSRSKDATPVQVSDSQGNSVFRVIYKLKGYEVVVESGTIAVDGKNFKATPSQKLSAPKLKNPKIEILEDKPKLLHRDSSYLWNLFFPKAYAKNPSQLSIRFAWEETPGAKKYLIQISKSPEFTEIITENKTSDLEFHLKLAAPTEKTQLYFRVAGIADDDSIGEFSPSEKVDVKPDPTLAIHTKPTPVKILNPAPVSNPSSIPAPEPMMTDQSVIEKPSQNLTSLWYGILYEQRKFKTDQNPKETSGSGFIPAMIGLEFQHAQNQRQYWSVGGTFTLEKAKPALTSPSDAPLNTSTIRAWATYGQSFTLLNQEAAFHIGPYTGTTSKISENGVRFVSKSILLLGLTGIIQSDPESFMDQNNFQWRAQFSWITLGSSGMDASAWLRKIIIKNGALKGFFGGINLQTRLTTIETSWGSSLDFGWRI